MVPSPTLIMGVINLTPDSFSDGGQFFSFDNALRHAEQLTRDGAQILDLGAESTRPGSKPVSVKTERERLEPVLKALQQKNLPVRLSVDTSKPETMRLAVEYGVTIINDALGGADPKTLEWLARQNVTYIAMHCHGTPETMQRDPLSGMAAVTAVEQFFDEKQTLLRETGFALERIWLDPGIGFGKTVEANLRLLREAMRRPERKVIGISRKSFLGRILNISEPIERDKPSKMLELALIFANVHVIRTHDVAQLVQLKQLLDT